MSRGVFNLHFLGRFGNQMFEYAFARGYCEMHDIELHTDPWVGEQLFEIRHPRCDQLVRPRDENTLVIGESNVSYRSYSQRQHCADYYSLRQIRSWFRWRMPVFRNLNRIAPEPDVALAHIRRGDYAGSGYPLVSDKSYFDAFTDARPYLHRLQRVSEDKPMVHPDFTGELAWVPDFFCMSTCQALYRANSSFSFWAGVLGQVHCGTQVFSPIITGKTGGIEHDCAFQPDNWARIAELDCVDQITIKPCQR